MRKDKVKASNYRYLKKREREDGEEKEKENTWASRKIKRKCKFTLVDIKKKDEDDEVSSTYSIYYSIQGLLILRILRMSFDWIDSHTHQKNPMWDEVDY